MQKNSRFYSAGSVIIISAVLLLLMCLFTEIYRFVYDSGFIPSDTYTYIEASRFLYDKHMPHPTRPLGAAAIFGALHIFNEHPSTENFINWAIFLNVAAWVISNLLWYKSFRMMVSAKASFWLTITLATSVGAIGHLFLLLTESITFLIISIASFHAIRNAKTDNLNDILWIAVWMNLLSSIRPGFVYVSALCTVYAITQIFPFKKTYRRATGILIVTVLLLFSNMWWMHKYYGKATLSFIDKKAYYMYLGTQIVCAVENTDYSATREHRLQEVQSLSNKEFSQFAEVEFRDHLINHPMLMLKYWLSNICENTSNGSYAFYACYRSLGHAKLGKKYTSGLLYKISEFQNKLLLLLYVMMAVLVLKKFKNAKSVEFFFLLLITYTILTSGISFSQGDRFSFILYPAILTFAVHTLCNWRDKYYSRRIEKTIKFIRRDRSKP